MSTNFLKAILNLYMLHRTHIKDFSKSTNRMNSMGESLERYVKDLFCNSYELNETAKLEAYSQCFSYIGNANHPPDIMIKEGDAIEVKKIENLRNSIALNSSYPKNKIFSSSPLITKDCRDCEEWEEKDFLYIIGVVNKLKLNSLTMVYGDVYAADKEIYERIAHKISSGLKEIPHIELAKTNELGRVNRADPLGITNLRIRGMWQIENPNKVFDFFIKPKNQEFIFNALVTQDKYLSFPLRDRTTLEAINDTHFVITNVKIPSPNNPAKLIEAKHISYRGE